jgi:hypothetical protein
VSEVIAALVGAIVGGCLTMWGAGFHARRERERGLRALSAALAAEILSLVELARRNRYEDALRAEIAQLEQPGLDPVPQSFTVPVSQSYFSVFEANAGHIGELDSKLAVEVIAFYQQARSWLDGASVGVETQVFVHRDAQLARYRLLADGIAKLADFGESLGTRLAPRDIRSFIEATAHALDASPQEGRP